MSTEQSVQRAKEEIFNAVRFLAPDEAARILQELAEGMRRLSTKYDRLLEEEILS